MTVKVVLGLAGFGGGGLHVETIRAVANACRAETDCRAIAFDLSSFIQRTRIDYTSLPIPVERLTPRDVGLFNVFRTTGPNLAISGARWRYRHMVSVFAARLVASRVNVLLTCRAYGFPERALIDAARQLEIPVAFIDEGPFSYPIRDRQLAFAEVSRLRAAVGLILPHLRLLPRRDFEPGSFSLIFATSPERERMFEASGVPRAKIVQVSAPRFDMLAETGERWARKRSERSGGPVRRILVLHQPFARDGKVSLDMAGEGERTLFDALAHVARERPIEICVRMHPRADAAERLRIGQLMMATGAASSFSDRPTFYDDVPEFDFFVGFYSTTLLEVTACGAPAVSVRLPASAFVGKAEAAKALAMEELGVASADDSEALACLIAKGLQATAVRPPQILFDKEFGAFNKHGARDVLQHLLALMH